MPGEQLPPFASNVTVCIVVQWAYSVREASVVTVLSSVIWVPPLDAVHHPANTNSGCVASGRLLYVFPIVYALEVVEQEPPFASNVTVCVVNVQCAYSVSEETVVTVLLAVTCDPPFADVHHPANAYPDRVAVGKEPYVCPIVYVPELVELLPPFALNVTVWLGAPS